jgi:hypothetical protein
VTAVLAAGALWCGPPLPADAQSAVPPRVTVAVLPPETSVGDLAGAGMAVGLMSAGIGDVPEEQTYLDISQGNRVNDALYESSLPLQPTSTPSTDDWPAIVRRALEVPAEIEPGLLASTLDAAGVSMRAGPDGGEAAVIATNRLGDVQLSEQFPGCLGRLCPGLTVEYMGLRWLSQLAARARGHDLLIAFAAAPPEDNRALPIGMGGGDIEGNLTSDSTRTDGYVLSTDVAPTILSRYGIGIPEEMDGEPIRSDGRADTAAVDGLGERMAAIPDRRAPVLIACVAGWILLAFAVNRIVFGLRRAAVAWLALSFAYMPLMLLAGAWREPSAIVEGPLVAFGAAILSAVTVRFAWGWRGLAIACVITVLAYAIDVIAGSGLTRLSLLGPNPIYGVRFYGIGNELEALFAVMVPVGVGAGLSALAALGKPFNEGAVLAFLAAGLVGAVVFGVGAFGADVGAAIVLPVGAVVAAASLSREALPGSGSIRPTTRRSLVAAAVILAPLLALALLAFIDLVSGGNSHLTRSVIDAGGASNLADVAERRLRLSAHDFAQAAGNPLFWIVVVGMVAAASQWRRIDGWLEPAPMARAGLIGACAAVIVGTLVNDSGASFLVLGGLALGAAVAYAWSQATAFDSLPRNERVPSG